MKKSTFVESIKAIKKQLEKDVENAKNINRVFENAFESNLLYDNEIITSQIIKILEECLGDDDKWIEYFVYELNYGERYKLGSVTDENGKPIDLSTAELLYDFLMKH